MTELCEHSVGQVRAPASCAQPISDVNAVIVIIIIIIISVSVHAVSEVKTEIHYSSFPVASA